jgi:1-acyl-sn-glycerol-3-phosphate acyltransferase
MQRLNTALRIALGTFYLMVTIPSFFTILVLTIWSRRRRIYLTNRMGRILSDHMLRIIGAKPTCKNREALDNSGPAIYVANHGSSLDVFIFGWACRPGTCGIAKKEIVWAPFVGPIVWLSGFLLIDRSNPGQALASMRRSTEFLQKSGLSAWVMPEGTRSMDGSLGPFKRGFVHMALQSKLPVIPIVIHDAHIVWPMDKLIFKSAEVEVEMLDPIDTSNWNVRTAQDHAASVRERIAHALAAKR